MTTPDAPANGPPKAPDPATDAPRAKRTAPARAAPNRSYTPEAAAPPRSESSARPGDVSTSEAIAKAVRLGYDVIGQNIEQGREAATRFRAGAYKAREAPQDLGRLAARMLNLTRELSTTTFDVLERLIQDPDFIAAARPAAPADGPDRDTSAGPPASGFYPGNPPSGPAAAPTDGSAAPPSSSIALTCNITGGRPAVMRAGALWRPDKPAFLVLSALTAVDPKLPPITPVTFAAAETGDGVIAHVSIRQDQPPGLYSGAICAYDTQIALGMLTIEVLP
jgi:hypothetical protein